MSEHLRYLVEDCLRPTEDLQILLEALHGSAEQTPASPSSPVFPGDFKSSPDEPNRRVLAVITHSEPGQEREEGSVLILKYKPSNTSVEALEVEHVYPIFGEFTITMAQSRRSTTLDLRPPTTPTTPSARPKTELSLTIHPGGEDQDADDALTLLTHDIQQLRSVLTECRRLKQEAADDGGTSQPLQTYSWLAPYTHHSPPTFAQSPHPPDLRIAQKPLHARLSHASAGVHGDDLADIELIREEWVLETARRDCPSEAVDLKIRVGTFNVNGNNPTQDLSSWVRGSAIGPPPMISPLLAVTPFAVDAVLPNPFDESILGSSPSSLAVPGTVDTPEPSTDKPTSSTFSSVATANSILSGLSETTLVDSNAPTTEEGPDMLVLGFQELDLSAEALLYSTSTVKADAWSAAVFAALGERAERYEKLASKQLVGILILVIVKKSIRSSFSDVTACSAGSGIMGLMGNKGGAAVRIKYTPSPTSAIFTPSPTVMTFVNSHLAAFDEMTDRRNADFQDLSKRLTFPSLPANQVLAPGTPIPLPFTIYQSDVLFWMGDLNYRLDIPDVDVRTILASETWSTKFDTLVDADQLKNAIRHKRAFEHFVEYPISHMPTYRFSAGILTDNLGYDTKRRPAWTDRILHLTSPHTTVEQSSYACHAEITMSDHHPVSADFKVKVEAFDKSYHHKVVQETYRRVVDFEHSDQRPQFKVEVKALDLGVLSYQKEVKKVFPVQNTGTLPCTFRFVPQDGEAPIHPEWLHVEPMAGLLLPGESTEITVTAFVDNKAASRLNLGPKDVNCTLIMHTAHGKDHFVAVTAQYEHTCFANKLTRLTRLPGPIRSTNPAQLVAENQAINAPREIMRLVNWMMSTTTEVDAVFLVPGETSIVGTIRECLDTGAEFPFASDGAEPHIVVAFGTALLELLGSLTEPVIPHALHTRCAQTADRDDAFELLSEFPSASVNVWISVTAFLHFISQQGPKSEETLTSKRAEKLATVFAPLFLRQDPNVWPPVSPLGKRNFVLCFIT